MFRYFLYIGNKPKMSLTRGRLYQYFITHTLSKTRADMHTPGQNPSVLVSRGFLPQVNEGRIHHHPLHIPWTAMCPRLLGFNHHQTSWIIFPPTQTCDPFAI